MGLPDSVQRLSLSYTSLSSTLEHLRLRCLYMFAILTNVEKVPREIRLGLLRSRTLVTIVVSLSGTRGTFDETTLATPSVRTTDRSVSSS